MANAAFMSIVSGMPSPPGPPPANRYDEKLKHLAYGAERLDELTHARALSADDRNLQFAYHFSAFIGAAASLRQYLQDDLTATGQINVPTDQPGALWFDDFKDQVDVAAIIGIRNTDVHDLSVRVTNVNHEMSFLATVQFNASSRIAYNKFNRIRSRLDSWSAWLRARISPPVQSLALPPVEQYAARYHLDPHQLGPDFMMTDRARPVWWTPSRNQGVKYNKGDQLVQRSAVFSRLQSADLGSIVTAAHAEIKTRILAARMNNLIP